jgi:8-oxo-dGTP pyrophosphatase MutT (NUDIX family)
MSQTTDNGPSTAEKWERNSRKSGQGRFNRGVRRHHNQRTSHSNNSKKSLCGADGALSAAGTAPKKRKTKQSLGVACCRINDGRPEVLMVCKRYTYAYNMFIHGAYNPNSNDSIRNLFNSMTTDEKHDILSLNFMQMWYRVWLHFPVGSNYYQSKAKFESAFLHHDNGQRLRKLISGTTNGKKIWEIPKGRKKNNKEPDIVCACREFQEETGLEKRQYKIYPKSKYKYSFSDDGINYLNIYYVAITRIKNEPRVNFSLQDQIDEVSDIRWMNIDEIKLIDTNRRLEGFLRPIFKFIKAQSKI